MENLSKRIAKELAAQNKLDALKIAKEISKIYIDTDFMNEEEYMLSLNKKADKILEYAYEELEKGEIAGCVRVE